ncbi:MAG: lipase [Clostridia bacterium]|nr:lipase [Clostridia bacterium]
MKTVTNYPYVLVHGMLGYGSDENMNKIAPYWGMLSGSLQQYLTDQGFEVYTPSVGKYSSAWDRACELYAQLVGGTVDYGVAHSKKYGHKRFGRTFSKPIFEGWGPDKKVNLVGHSFGGATIRLLATLLANGSEAEKAATPENELSDLFKGGKEDWVFSITAVASVHEGTTLLYSARHNMNVLDMVTYGLAAAGGNNWFGRLYNGNMDQWDLSKMPISIKKMQKVKDSHDNVWYDLTMQGAKEVNETIECLPNVYYFSWPCCKTSQLFFSSKPKHTPRLTMSPVFQAFSRSIGKYSVNDVDDYPIDEHWLANDGVVPTISETAPFNEPHMDLYDLKGKEPKKGMWYVYDVFPCDHLGIIGGFLLPTSASKLQPWYRNHFRMINQLKK